MSLARSQLALVSLFASALTPGCFLVGDYKLDADAGAPRPSTPSVRPRPTLSAAASEVPTGSVSSQDAAVSAALADTAAAPTAGSPTSDGGAEADSGSAATAASHDPNASPSTSATASDVAVEPLDGGLADAADAFPDANPPPQTDAAQASDSGLASAPDSTVDVADAAPEASIPAASCSDEQQNQGETAVDCGGPCRPCAADLRHRFSFTGSGTEALDSMGGPPGVVTGTTLKDTGYVDLKGGDYVDLPNGILSSLSSATIEIWLTWRGTTAWQRVFDFGSSSAGEGMRDYGLDYLMFTPRGSDDRRLVDYSVDGLDGNVEVQGSGTLPARTEVHVAVVVDAVAATLSLYINGQRDVQAPFNISLSEIEDNNNWIGRSQYSVDPAFNGNVTEVRIYGEALTEAQLQANQSAGPDTLPWD